ncbi:phage tail assembly protein [Aurantimonas sp. 22II-16-19i]|uniref:phage tail assembly protein n=1 Tax=Aurantimonas sp. 22II-16-19i TaxID=1317114 RepID=UPI0009F7F1B9|nr:phage tail assembly protein [Aurantimonas sp. 22II-16-19i]ORE87739.1 hypothetical protein ATO4_25333 [Aurantimonas sp. 22II-16-19i]
MSEIVVTLSRRYDHGSKPFDELRFREPKLKDRIALGPPFEVIRDQAIWDDAVVWKYVDRLLMDVAPGAIQDLDYADGEAVYYRFRDFFIDASPLFVKRTSSFSGSGGTPAPSAT